MSYRTVKDGISNLLKGLGYTESKDGFTLDNQSPHEMGITYVILASKGDLDEGPGGNSESLSDRIYDVQEWQIQFAIPKSDQNEIINRDDILDRKDTIIKTLDKPANWSSYVRIQKYLRWSIDQRPSYYVLSINLKIVDTIVYQ